jgi:hypothetical protein
MHSQRANRAARYCVRKPAIQSFVVAPQTFLGLTHSVVLACGSMVLLVFVCRFFALQGKNDTQ